MTWAHWALVLFLLWVPLVLLIAAWIAAGAVELEDEED